MFDAPGTPLVAALALLAIPGALIALATWLEFRRRTPLAYRCRRCGADFFRPPHHPFPRACARCRARDWNG